MNNRHYSRTIFIAIFLSTLFVFTISQSALFAQTDPEETAVPYPAPVDPVATEPPVVDSGYPEIIPTATPANPTPYPIFTATPFPTAGPIPVVGDENTSSFITPIAPIDSAPDTGDIFQSNLILWIGFIIGLLILGTGVYGAIILYTRK